MRCKVNLGHAASMCVALLSAAGVSAEPLPSPFRNLFEEKPTWN